MLYQSVFSPPSPRNIWWLRQLRKYSWQRLALLTGISCGSGLGGVLLADTGSWLLLLLPPPHPLSPPPSPSPLLLFSFFLFSFFFFNKLLKDLNIWSLTPEMLTQYGGPVVWLPLSNLGVLFHGSGLCVHWRGGGGILGLTCLLRKPKTDTLLYRNFFSKMLPMKCSQSLNFCP